MPRQNITAKWLESKKPLPASGQVDWFDVTLAGFGVRCSSSGTRSFFLMYRRPGAGTKARLTFKPSFPALSLAEAREKAAKALRQIGEGVDPGRAEKAEAREPAKPDTFSEAVEDFILRYAKGQRRNKRADDVRAVLLRLGRVEALELDRLRLKAAGKNPDKATGWLDRPVNEIDARELRRLLEAIRDGFPDAAGKLTQKPRPYLANRAHAYLATFFRWCLEDGIDKVAVSPMARLPRPFDGEEARDRVFDADEIKAIWRAADEIGGHAGGFIKVLMLTGKRKNALAAMRYEEIGVDGVWTPPQDTRRRAGNKRNHAIPLPDLARRIIQSLPRVEEAPGELNPYVFAGRHKRGHLDPGTPLKEAVRERSGVADFFYHGARHSVETSMAELRIPPHVRDLILDHAPMRGSGAGYDHFDYRAEMAEALEKWADHVQRIVAGDKVTLLRG